MSEFTEALYEKYPSLKKFEDPSYQDEWNDGRENRLLEFIYSHPNLEAMRGNPAEILAAMDDFAQKQDFLISIGPHKAAVVSDLISVEKPRVVVELGGYLGYSAILFAVEIRKVAATEHVKDLRVWSLEASPLFAAITMSFVNLAGLADIVRVVTGKAGDSLKRLHANGDVNRIDWLFLDHLEDLYIADLKVVESLGLLQPGTTVVADNVVRPGAPEYREYVRGHPNLVSQGVRGLIVPGDLEDELEISRYKA